MFNDDVDKIKVDAVGDKDLQKNVSKVVVDLSG